MELHWALTLWHAGCMLAPWGASRGMLSDHAWQSQLLGCSYFTFTLFHICTKYQWGSFTQLRDPQKYNENKKPSEMRLTPSYHSSVSRLVPPQQPMSMLTPYPFYPPPHMYLPQPPWPMNLQSVLSTSQPMGPSQNCIEQPKFVTGPAISAWLQCLNSHPYHHHNYNKFATLAPNFEVESYWTIDQLTRGCMSIEKLSSWIKIGKIQLIIPFSMQTKIWHM